MKNIIKTAITTFLFALLLNSPAARATLAATIDTGVLKGFTDITVNSLSYNVVFVDGSFATALNSTLEFTTSTDALAATVALNAAYDLNPTFDNSVSNTFGCVGNLNQSCFIYTPWRVRFDPLNNPILTAVTVRNTASIIDANSNDTLVNPNTLTQDDQVFALWTRNTANVPEPAITLLIGSGILGLFSVKVARRKVLV